ncbi:aminotransferase class V-fold PLP-dependent enzyme [Streptomyces capparidis]
MTTDAKADRAVCAAREENRRLLADVARYAVAFLDDDRPVRASEPEALGSLLGGPLPEEGHPPTATVRRLVRAGEAGALASGAPRSFGYAVGGALPVGVAADWLTALWDQCAVFHDLSPLAAVAEEVCEGWLTDLLGLPTGTVMGLTSGCTTANLVCLAAAREHQLRRAGWAVNEQGMTGAPPLTVLVGAETHVSVLRCLRLLGLGGAIRQVLADAEGRMDIADLRRQAAAAHGGLIVCGQVGSINCGSVDPLREAAAVVRAHDGWLHLDGAFGLWAAASPSRRRLLEGVADADSWSCDGHKWLNTPYDCGLAFCARPAPFRQAVNIHADYIHSTARTGRDPMDYRMEMSQRARALTLWAVLHHLGRDGVAALVDRTCDAALHLARQLSEEPGIELLAPVRLNQVLVRVGDEDHTRRVVRRLNADGTCWVTPTQWQGSSAVRLSVCSWRTDPQSTEPAVAAFLATHRAEQQLGRHPQETR